MIAVYYSNKSPRDLIAIPVEDDDFQYVLNILAGDKYPWPSTDVLFIENDKVVNSLPF